ALPLEARVALLEVENETLKAENRELRKKLVEALRRGAGGAGAVPAAPAAQAGDPADARRRRLEAAEAAAGSRGIQAKEVEGAFDLFGSCSGSYGPSHQDGTAHFLVSRLFFLTAQAQERALCFPAVLAREVNRRTTGGASANEPRVDLCAAAVFACWIARGIPNMFHC
ncbi:unnamed protein product, partial [Prorocentrum cordatum]